MSNKDAAPIQSAELAESIDSEEFAGRLCCYAVDPAEEYDGIVKHIDAWRDEQVRDALAAVPATAAPTAPTDISAQLREFAGNPGYSHGDYADVMRLAADECERFYGGMVAWKKTAQAKDASWNEHVAEIVEKRVKAAQPIADVSAPIGYADTVSLAALADAAEAGDHIRVYKLAPDRPSVPVYAAPANSMMPTNLTQRLREYAKGEYKNAPTHGHIRGLMAAAADEIERLTGAADVSAPTDERAAGRMREECDPEDFGVPAEWAARAHNYAEWFAARAAAPVSAMTDKLLLIIAYAYQIAGAHDAPDHILDVLANPEEASDEQIEAMLPYVVAPVSGQAAQEQAQTDLMPKRVAFIAWCKSRHLDTDEDKDAWGKRKFKHSHIEAMWEGWFNAPAVVAQEQAAGVALSDAACPGCNGIGVWVGGNDGYDDAECFQCGGVGRIAAPTVAAPSDDLVVACRALIDYCDKNPPMADSLWCVQQIRAALAAPTGASQSAAIGWLYDWTHSSALGKPDEHFTGFTRKREDAFRPTNTNQRQVCLTAHQEVIQSAVESCVVEGSEGRALCAESCAKSGICTWKKAPPAAMPAQASGTVDVFFAEDGVEGRHHEYGRGTFFTDNCMKSVVLAAAPPAPAPAIQAQPLTDADIDKIWTDTLLGSGKPAFMVFALAIERHLAGNAGGEGV